MSKFMSAQASMGSGGNAESNLVASMKNTSHTAQQSASEVQQREAGNFGKVESELKVHQLPRHISLKDKIGCQLRECNPLARAANPYEHVVWLLDNTAVRVPGTDKWTVEVVAAYFYKSQGGHTFKPAAKISEILGLASNHVARQTIERRLEPVMAPVLPAHYATLQVEGQTFKLGPSSREGLRTDKISFISKARPGSVIYPSLVGLSPHASATTFLVERHGWGIISDVDDTIKKTLTCSALGILRTTFVDTPERIQGMAELYRYMQQVLHEAAFWYLSASPYTYYPFLRTFRQHAGFPQGQLLLQTNSYMTLAGLLTCVTQGTQAYKVDRMRRLYRCLPDRSFICIGDSTQSDPEAYAHMWRETKGKWIKAIFIRRVSDIAEIGVDMAAQNKPERFQKAFQTIPSHVWFVFSSPVELYTRIDRLLCKSSAQAC